MSQFTSLSELEEGPSIVNNFRTLCESVSELVCREQVALRPYKSPALPFFSRLPLERQKGAVHRLKQYQEVCESTLAEGGKLRDTPTFTWKMLKSMHLTPTHDLFSKLEAGDIIEFYNLDSIQFFRNLRFFEICSYSLEELHCSEWWELFRREDAVNRQIYEATLKIFSGQEGGTFQPNIQRHVLEEKASECLFRMDVDVKFLSPLYSGRDLAGFATIEGASLHS